MRGNLVAAWQLAGVTFLNGHARALQLGLGLWHHFVKPARLHQREALQSQRRDKLAQCHGPAHRPVRDQGQCALDARVHHHIAPGDAGKGARHGLDFSSLKIQGDAFIASGSRGRLCQRIHRK